jgi:hypothetical protein
MNILDETGKCKKCERDAQNEFMECWLCTNRYHVIECDGVDPMVQTSFLKNQWPNISRKWACLTFTCLACKEDAKTKQETVMSGRVRLLEETALKTNKQLEDIKSLLTTVINNRSQNEEKSNTVSDPELKETPTLIVVEKADQEEEEEVTKEKWSEVTKAAIKSKVGVSRSFTNKAGQSVFICNSEKSKKALLPHVEKVFHNRRINTPKPKLPTITVPFIVGKYENEELLDVLRKQNEDRGIRFSRDNAQVLFTAPMRDREGMYQAVIRISEDIRNKIKDNDNRLCIGINSCPVFDRFFIKRCNNCQEFHHFQNDNGGCKKEKVCALCTGKHDTRDCHTDANMHKCINCAKADRDEFSHAAFSYDCPSYIAEQEKLRKSINYYSKNT